jgi:hypothetical protein
VLQLEEASAQTTEAIRQKRTRVLVFMMMCSASFVGRVSSFPLLLADRIYFLGFLMHTLPQH